MQLILNLGDNTHLKIKELFCIYEKESDSFVNEAGYTQPHLAVTWRVEKDAECGDSR